MYCVSAGAACALAPLARLPSNMPSRKATIPGLPALPAVWPRRQVAGAPRTSHRSRRTLCKAGGRRCCCRRGWSSRPARAARSSGRCGAGYARMPARRRPRPGTGPRRGVSGCVPPKVMALGGEAGVLQQRGQLVGGHTLTGCDQWSVRPVHRGQQLGERQTSGRSPAATPTGPAADGRPPASSGDTPRAEPSVRAA
jgi:hypothetical protein